MDIILATRNPSKTEQIAAMFRNTRFRILSLSDAGVDGEVVEDGTTLYENALKKARYAHERMRIPAWTMADDTGLFIEVLGGEPGVNAAYWGGHEIPTEERMQYCLNRLAGETNRRAIFRTTVVTISPDGKEDHFVGEVTGRILEAPQVRPQKAMPYSALFVPEGSTKAWAEMSVEEENRLSHRGKAFRHVLRHFEQL